MSDLSSASDNSDGNDDETQAAAEPVSSGPESDAENARNSEDSNEEAEGMLNLHCVSHHLSICRVLEIMNFNSCLPTSMAWRSEVGVFSDICLFVCVCSFIDTITS